MRFTVQRTSSLTDLDKFKYVKKEDEPSASSSGISTGTTPEPELDQPREDENEGSEPLIEALPKPSDQTTQESTFGSNFFEPVARRGQFFANRQKTRLVEKGGDINISQYNIKSKGIKFIIDIFTTLVDLKWRYNLLMFAMGFLCTWIGFTVIWWIILMIRGDNLHADDPDWTPCMAEVYDFTTALLFSIETQHTIGYGSRGMTPKCPEAIIVLMLQSGIGVFVQSLMTGIIFAKLSRPKRRAQTVLFSKNAVICLRDGVCCLLFRVGDMRKSQIIGSSIRAIMVKNRCTKEGETIPFCQYPLTVQTESSTDTYAFLATPVTVVHKIDSNSPLWSLSADELLVEHFEIIVLVEGTIESTGQTTQLRTSYLPSEIVWGHRLKPLVTYHRENGKYKIDFGLFHETESMEMPEVSPREMHEKQIMKPGLFGREIPMNFTAPPRPYRPGGPKLIKRLWSLKRRPGEGGARLSDYASTNGDLSEVYQRCASLKGVKRSNSTGSRVTPGKATPDRASFTPITEDLKSSEQLDKINHVQTK